ncbi:hypothetical protein M408DRAFT_78246 [Serendipita vermifera MAFF 305830]|uniref:Uncharacterized protein n=1 Tax=Serendipita vermifera MAFF 305830 TaxID=933852 RepID=A0A0C3AE92_SERVB|nr:hypothetical protein M408DRAFT_78246 [Serendipita vermifera MAFF 305830]
MLVLFLTYYLAQSAQSEAGPILAFSEPQDVASRDDRNIQRSLANILWSCLSTIFLCTWMAIHPNVHFKAEKPDQRWFERWLWDPLHDFVTYKLPLFLWALLVPEYLLAWAVRQYMQAGVISNEGKIPGWTRTHGHFMIMGGFHLFRIDEIPVCPLKFEDVPVDILEIIAPTETELKDRGKSDVLTKFIVLVQTLWFVVQCIARKKQHLPLTELEVVTLAYTALNLFIYVFWWDKPRNIDCPIRIYKTSMATHEESGEKVDEWNKNWAGHWIEKMGVYTIGGQDQYTMLSEKLSIPMFWSGMLNENYQGDAGLGPSLLGSVFGAIHCIAWSSEFPSRAELILWRISCVAMITVPFLVVIICVVGVADQQDCFVILSKETSIPMFWSGRLKTSRVGEAGLGPSILGIAFGAIHCIAWSSKFPSHSEAVLWRISCIAMITLPFITTIACLIELAHQRTEKVTTRVVNIIFCIGSVFLILSAWLYMVGRIATLVIAFATLRSLPPAAYATVGWTSLVPHI